MDAVKTYKIIPLHHISVKATEAPTREGEQKEEEPATEQGYFFMIMLLLL